MASSLNKGGDDKVECPKCGAEMEPGYAFGRIPWLPEEAKYPTVWSKKSVEKAGGVMLTNPLVRTVDGIVHTQLCKQCQVGFIDYK